MFAWPVPAEMPSEVEAEFVTVSRSGGMRATMTNVTAVRDEHLDEREPLGAMTGRDVVGGHLRTDYDETSRHGS